jgi:hypothetical protein
VFLKIAAADIHKVGCGWSVVSISWVILHSRAASGAATFFDD